jgi:hypothetical protein
VRVDIPAKAWALVRDTTDIANEYPEAVSRLRRTYRATITHPHGVTIHADVDDDDAAMLRAYVLLCRKRLSRRGRVGQTEYEQLVALQRALDTLDKMLCGQPDAP